MATLWLYGILVLRDYVAVEHANWDMVEQKHSRARATAAAADWPIRAQEMKGALADLEALLWREGSSALSQAAFEERITQSFAAANIPVRSIRTTAITDGTSATSQLSLIQLRSRVQIEFRPSNVYPWIAAIARSKSEKSPTIIVESLATRASSIGQVATADLELVGYAVRAASVGDSTPATVSSPSPNRPK